MKSLMERWGELTETHEREIAKLRADLVSARKWAKAWKGKNGYDRMMHEIYKKVRDELAEDLSEARNEIERLNGRRCDGCKHYHESDTTCWAFLFEDCMAGHCVPKDHYCKLWSRK